MTYVCKCHWTLLPHPTPPNPAQFFRQRTASLPPTAPTASVFGAVAAPHASTTAYYRSSWVYTLWWTNILPWNITMLLMGKSTISMAIFHCYVSSWVYKPTFTITGVVSPCFLSLESQRLSGLPHSDTNRLDALKRLLGPSAPAASRRSTNWEHRITE